MSVLATARKISTDLLSYLAGQVGIYIRPMKNVTGRINDKRLERHIQFLSECELSALRAGQRDSARRLELARLAAIRCRSQAQVERMERAKGLR